MKHNGQSGFTLVEIAIVIAITGLLMGGSMMMIKPYVETAKINATRDKLERIADSLAQFQQNYHRLPCPAVSNSTPPGGEPFGAPIQSGTNGTNFVTQGCGAGGAWNGTIPDQYTGIVPFRALGLNEDNVRDGYGNLITYTVAPVLAVPVPAVPSTQNVHQACRTTAWTDASTAYDDNKARFCCPFYRNAASDIKVLDSLGSSNQVYTGQHDTANYASVTSGPVTPTNFNSHVIAFVLVSHGKNGDGAYIKKNASGARNPVTANASAQESENRNGNMTFVDTAYSKTNDTNYFDDIILWRTNDQVVANFGNESCGRP